jgi:release factor glutamine methyltransferase
MNKNEFYTKMLTRLESSAIFQPDFPDENAITTLHILWNFAAGNSRSELPEDIENLPELSGELQEVIQTLVTKRLEGTPLAYMTGRTRFMNLDLYCEPGVLIPRPETELLCSTVLSELAKVSDGTGQLLGIDIGCGCGNLSCGIAANNANVQIHAIDLTDECVALSGKNVAALRLDGRITVHKGDMFSPLSDTGLEGKVDFIVSNPPYIPSSKLHSDLTHLTAHEPEEAFNGGIYGFGIHQRLIRDSLTWLKAGGVLAFEFGIGQERQIEALFRRVRCYEEVQFASDVKGNPRVVLTRYN